MSEAAGVGHVLAGSAALLQGLEVGTTRIAGHLPDPCVDAEPSQARRDQIGELLEARVGASRWSQIGDRP